MIGIFDSGAGGLAALSELRTLCPFADAVFLADRENAPYGTKSKSEIISLSARAITRLAEAGAERVLIACCTASSVWQELPREVREISVPIIAPTARCAADLTENGKISVIATEHTVISGVFKNALELLGDFSVTTTAAQPLVGLAEELVKDGVLTSEMRRELLRALMPTIEHGADTLILGCTHFSHFENEINKILNEVKTVNSAKIGASEIAKHVSDGYGATVFL